MFLLKKKYILKLTACGRAIVAGPQAEQYNTLLPTYKIFMVCKTDTCPGVLHCFYPARFILCVKYSHGSPNFTILYFR